MGKNANGAGTPPKKMPGRDLYRARYTDPNGKQKSVYGTSYKECREKWIEGYTWPGLMYATASPVICSNYYYNVVSSLTFC